MNRIDKLSSTALLLVTASNTHLNAKEVVNGKIDISRIDAIPNSSEAIELSNMILSNYSCDLPSWN